MCGIAGVAGRGRRADAETDVRRMTEALVHRGPDDEGYWSDERIALGMRRLSIIDLAGGHQPMTGDGGVTIVFNGEIYNYRALRAELLGGGRRFRTTSDTEVVLALYEAEGIEAVQRLEGMFATCIWDPRAGIAHLVRDRLGKKPLYFAPEPERLLFASEIKAILAALPSRPALDRQALHHYLTLRYVPAPLTPWEGIRKLEPGHRLEVDVRSGERSLHRY